jgi:hypothetical protein
MLQCEGLSGITQQAKTSRGGRNGGKAQEIGGEARRMRLHDVTDRITRGYS